MAPVGFAGFFILVMIGCVVALGASLAENWQRILSAFEGEMEAAEAARSFTTSQCSPSELPLVAERMILADRGEQAMLPEEPHWSSDQLPRRGRQMAFKFA
jgi:hypothetical protein